MSKARPEEISVRLYRALLALLPPWVSREDREEMTETFAALWADDLDGTARLRLWLRSFRRLPGALTVEWLELLRPDRHTRGRTFADGASGNLHGGGGRELMESMRQARHAVRTLRNAPAFAVTTVLLIALGVGAVTTIFTVVDHVLLRPLPYPAAERLITIQNGAHSGVLFRELERLEGVESWAGGSTASANLTGEGDPIQIEMSTVTEAFFTLFGARPEQGRLFVAEDFTSPTSVIVSYGAWSNLFGRDPSLVGRTLRVDGVAHEVVGVLSEEFVPPQHLVEASTAIYRPIDWTSERYGHPGNRSLQVAGRMASGVTLGDVTSRLDVLSATMADRYPDQHVDRDGNRDEFLPEGLQESTVQDVRTNLNLLFAAVGLLLLVACLNVAHLFLARGLGRIQEMAIRRVMGAGVAGLLRQLTVESALVGVVGGGLGLTIAYFGLEGLLAINPHALPRAEAIRLDWRVATFAGGVSILTALVFGLVPAMRTMSRNLAGELRGSSRSATAGAGTRRLRSGLVVAEVAVSLILVAQAGLLLKSYLNAQAPSLGFDPEGVWTIPLTPTGHETPDSYREAMAEVLASLAAVPGVESATYGMTQPLEWAGAGRCCWSNTLGEAEGVGTDRLRVFLHPVTPEYFETLRIPFEAGGVWGSAEATLSPTPVIASERFAIDAFGSSAAAMGLVFGRENRPLRIVGVAADTKHYGLDQPDPVQVYVPMELVPFVLPLAHFAVRINGEAPAGLVRTLREAVWRAAPELPVPNVRSMDDWLEDSMAGRRFDSVLFGAFGAVALLLAAAGLYGTLLYNVRQQRRELGIRLALGAARARVERRVVGGGVGLAALGSGFGALGALWIGRMLEGRLYGVEGGDPTAIIGGVVILLVTAGLASWLPARRAGRTNPLETLRVE